MQSDRNSNLCQLIISYGVVNSMWLQILVKIIFYALMFGSGVFVGMMLISMAKVAGRDSRLRERMEENEKNNENKG